MGIVLAKAVNPFVLNCLTCKHANTQKNANTQTRKHAHTQTRKHADTQTRKHANTQTRQHANTPTRQHANTPTRQHANTQTRKHAKRFPLPISPKRLLARDHGIGRVRRGCRPSATKPGGERQAFRRVSGYRIRTTLVVGGRLGAPSPFPCRSCHGKPFVVFEVQNTV